MVIGHDSVTDVMNRVLLSFQRPCDLLSSGDELNLFPVSENVQLA